MSVSISVSRRTVSAAAGRHASTAASSSIAGPAACRALLRNRAVRIAPNRNRCRRVATVQMRQGRGTGGSRIHQPLPPAPSRVRRLLGDGMQFGARRQPRRRRRGGDLGHQLRLRLRRPLGLRLRGRLRRLRLGRGGLRLGGRGGDRLGFRCGRGRGRLRYRNRLRRRCGGAGLHRRRRRGRLDGRGEFDDLGRFGRRGGGRRRRARLLAPPAPASATPAAAPPSAFALALALVRRFAAFRRRRLGRLGGRRLRPRLAGILGAAATAAATPPAALLLPLRLGLRRLAAPLAPHRCGGLLGDLLRRLVLVFRLDHRRLDRPRRRRLAGRVAAHPFEPEVRRNQRVVAVDGDADVVARLDLGQRFALLVEQVERHRRRHVDADLGGALADALFLDRAQNVERRRLGRADRAGTAAMRARLGRRLAQRRAQPLPRHLEQAERADAADLDAGPVVLQSLLQPALHRAVVAVLLHVDEPGKVAQAQLPGDLVGGFEIGAQRRLFDVALARRAAGIDVDRDQRLGLVDDDVAAGAELGDRRVDRVDLALDLVAVEQPDLRVAVRLHPLGVARHQHAHEGFGGLVAFFALDQHLVDVAGVEVADRALDQVAFLVDQRRRARFERQVANLVPQPQQIFVVALDLGLGALGPGGADDDPDAFGDVEVFENLLQPAAVGHAGDLARHPAAAAGIRHQHAVAPGERQVGGQRRPLVAALFLDDLHQHDLPALDHLLDLVAARGPGALALLLVLLALLAGQHLVAAQRLFAAQRLDAFDLGGELLARRGGLRLAGLDQLARRRVELGALRLRQFRRAVRRGAALRLARRAIADRNAVVVRMDLVEGEKPVPVAAVIDKGGLQRRLYAGDLREIDVSLDLPLGRRFEIELVEAVAAEHHDPSLLGVGGIDKHASCHSGRTPGRARKAAAARGGWGTGLWSGKPGMI